MKPRERMLAISIGGLVGIGILWYGVSSLQASWAKLDAQLKSKEQTLQQKQNVVRNGQKAAKKLAAFEMRGLPSNVEKGQSLYQKWLLDLVQKHGLRDSSVTAVSRMNARGVYQQIAFAVKGQADLQQVTKLLYDFYAVDHLHRIRRLRLKPRETSTDLDVDLLVEVLALPGSPDRNDLVGQPSTDRLQFGDMDDYVKAIASRNFFGPPHQPPTVTTSAKSKYYIGDAVVFGVRGEDPEKTPVSFVMEKATFEGAKLDPKNGDFRWEPKEKGTYEFTVRVTDTGMPAKSVSKTIKFEVTDPPPKQEPVAVKPPPPPPPFDTAKHTFLTGVVGADDQSEAWLQVRTTGQMLKLRTGEKFDVGTLKGKIHFIGEQEIQIETTDGKRLLVYIGECLRDGLPLPPDGI